VIPLRIRTPCEASNPEQRALCAGQRQELRGAKPAVQLLRSLNLNPASTETSSPTAPNAAKPHVPRGLLLLLAVACGIIVANIYYAQPLAGPIGQALGLNVEATGLIVTLTQIGYGLGLLFVVPLGDLIETRRLVLVALAISFGALLLAATANFASVFLLASLIVGVSSTAVQILVPYAAHLAPVEVRGKVIGQVMSGLLIGIMLSRPAASFVDDLWGWKAIFYIAAGLMALIAIALAVLLPPRRPQTGARYFELLASMVWLYRTTPVLRRRAFYQALLFGAFTLFWTTSPLLLAGPAFHLSQRGIALFALAGVAGALAAPLAGHLADKGWSRTATGLAMFAVLGGFLLTRITHQGSAAILLLTAGAILLDFGVSSSLVIGQRAIYTLGAEYRSRLNGLFMATFFAGGAVCSAAGAWAYARGGWGLASLLGIALPLAGLAYFATEKGHS
jgi:predicted MFS family arabinose efflux permease